MFAARGIAVSFSVFVLVYCTLSLAVSLSWRIVWRRIQHHPVRRIADILFALRMLPWLAACVITAAFTIPSFLLLEPRAIEEPLGGLPLSLGICGAVLGIFGIVLGGWSSNSHYSWDFWNCECRLGATTHCSHHLRMDQPVGTHALLWPSSCAAHLATGSGHDHCGHCPPQGSAVDSRGVPSDFQ